MEGIMLRKLSVVFVLGALMGLLITPFSTNAASSVTSRAAVVGRDLVYSNGVMVSLDAGTGLLSPSINPDTVGSASVIPCSSGYTCIYEHANYGGRRLQWRDPGQLINLTDYGFNDKMSSWRNLN